MTQLAVKKSHEGALSEAEQVRQHDGMIRILLYGSALAAACTMAILKSGESVAAVALIFMLTLLFAKVPVGLALAVPSLWGIFQLRGLLAFEGMLASIPYSAVASWSLQVIPLFIFMGAMLWRSGATALLFELATRALRWLPGGLAIATNGAGGILSAISGESMGTAYALGRIGIPEMLRAGYHPRLATASVLMAGNLGQLIPPSIMMVIFAGVVSEPIGPLLMAGVVPGLVLMLLYMVGIAVLSSLKPNVAGGRRGRSARSVRMTEEGQANPATGRLVVRTIPVFILIFIVIAGIYSGVMTATEAAAVAAVSSVVVGLAVNASAKNFLSSLNNAFNDTVKSTAALFLVIIGASMFVQLVALSGLGAPRFISKGGGGGGGVGRYRGGKNS
jgi:tripartite ATP-independent transporter DctM subunit